MGTGGLPCRRRSPSTPDWPAVSRACGGLRGAAPPTPAGPSVPRARWLPTVSQQVTGDSRRRQPPAPTVGGSGALPCEARRDRRRSRSVCGVLVFHGDAVYHGRVGLRHVCELPGAATSSVIRACRRFTVGSWSWMCRNWGPSPRPLVISTSVAAGGRRNRISRPGSRPSRISERPGRNWSVPSATRGGRGGGRRGAA
jgi:hypothetical protein